MSKKKQTIAAIDIGSNTLHLLVASLDGEKITPIDSLKQTVRLASGLDHQNNLSIEKIYEAAESLKIFGQRIKDFDPRNVKCVGTNTLRKAKNSNLFLAHAEQALGFPINIIGGREEARLVYQGVARSIAQTKMLRLVIDIGGGSTEFIIGQDNRPILMESLNIGCVNFTQKYFSSGKISNSKVNKAILAARQHIEWICDEYIDLGWQEVIGSSGTIKSIASILEFHYQLHGVIDLKHLNKLLKKLIKFKYIENIELEGLSSGRLPIIVGGVCVLKAIFEEFNIKKMVTSKGALREGLLFDMLDTAEGRDIRTITISHMIKQYSVDKKQVRLTKDIAAVLMQQLGLAHKKDIHNLINWSIDLHEVGLNISHINAAQHSAYIVEQSDMPGFSREFQNTLGTLLRLQRGKIKKKLIQSNYRYHKKLSLLILVMRLAIMLTRGRDRVDLSKLNVIKSKRNIKLEFPEQFLAQHPLIIADLYQEQKELGKLDIFLEFSDLDKNS